MKLLPLAATRKLLQQVKLSPDQGDIAASKAVLARTTNADGNKFAQIMEYHHTRAANKLLASASAEKLCVGRRLVFFGPLPW